MSQTRPTYQATGQGWALFDWEYHATRPQLTFRAGCMDATRIQFDAYRRWVHMPHWAAEVQFWCWSQNDFPVNQIRRSGIGPYKDVLIKRHYPQAWPQSIDVANDIRVREYRLPTDITSPWGSGKFQNLFATTPVQMTNTGRWAGVFTIATTPDHYSDPFATKIDILWPGTKSVVRVLALGHHNETWRMGNIPQ